MEIQSALSLQFSDADVGGGVARDKSSASLNPGPSTPPVPLTDEEIVSGRFFLRQLCISDRFFGLLAEDYLDGVLRDTSVNQSVNNWNIIAVVLGDHGLMINEEVLFRLMSGEPELAAAVTEDIHSLKQVLQSGVPPRSQRWKVLLPASQKEVPLKQRLNPFVFARDTQKAPTAIYLHDADRLNKMRSYVVLQMKELEAKIVKAKEKKTMENRIAEVAAQQKMVEEQVVNMNLHKSEMLRLLEGLEAKFLSDERRIHQMKKLAVGGGTASPPPPSAAAATSPAGKTERVAGINRAKRK